MRGRSPVGAKYDTSVNRESAYELLTKRAAPAGTAPTTRPPAAPAAPAGRPTPEAAPGPQTAPAPRTEPASPGLGDQIGEILWGTKRRQGMVESMAKQAARTVGSEVGRQILRGVLGGILGGARRR